MKSTPTPAGDREPQAASEPSQSSEATLALKATAAPAPTPAPAADATLVLKATPTETPAASAESVVPGATSHATSRVAPRPQVPVRGVPQWRAIGLAGAAILVIGALAIPRRPAAPSIDAGAAASKTEPREQPADLVGERAQPSVLRAAPIEVSVTAAAPVAPGTVNAASKNTLASKLAKTRAAESTKSGAPIAAMTPIADIPFEDATAKLPGSDAIAPPPPPSVSNGAGAMTPVTITGCLEISVNHDEFRLTDTEGIDAPRSRSWRSGFLRKRSAPVALVDVPDRLALQTHVGRRVAATGVLTSRDLKVSALRVVGSPCN